MRVVFVLVGVEESDVEPAVVGVVPSESGGLVLEFITIPSVLQQKNAINSSVRVVAVSISCKD